METTARVDRGTVHVWVEGELDAEEARGLGAELDAYVVWGAADLLVDLTAVEFLDSAGLRVLTRSWRAQKSRGRRLSVVPPDAAQPRRVFRLTGFDAVFDVIDHD